VTPAFVYTTHPSAELFINGKSQGRQEKNNSTLQNRYRLMWNDVKYEPGEVKVIAYDAAGKPVKEAVVCTAGAPHHIELSVDRSTLKADGEDLAYINVRIVDKDGNFCPTESREIQFEVEGAGTFRASANGDPTCVYLFHEPKMPLFSGQLTALVQATTKSGKITFTAKADGVESASITIKAK
jgi:beta-galactosidase